ncbi:aminodeoxychorismate/anthranilate synthase component II [Nocardioides marmoriginsengisoli]|uniref:Aminodeoxychorismate/anthranilate synthase component II n=1 Tax=Nocardioides marmoriginsengisoli TaxID=661483 RepID=A0A3N0CAP1_9ACTN|nr:aminodeoxychorismate/anthranilate synthase component II [Nocardioides marmoriginsengisoli]RNL60527.1 aminodeoxychorismate/anthranilate synthase component II [Nocardioides marmoriginsengisoli]
MTVLVVDHHDSYTWNLVHLIAGVTGTLPDVVEHDEPGVLERARGYRHLVLSPGPGHPASPRDFALGSAVFQLGRPVLGVCLGMQALAVAYGGTVERIEPAHGEVAAVEHDGTGVFAGVPDGVAAVRYHSLAVTVVPDELRVTATADGVVMGLAHRTLPLHGVQFHPESILSEHGALVIANFLEPV